MWYLLGAGASEKEPTAGLPWAAAVVNKVAVAAGAARATSAVVAGAAGGVAARGGEELRSLGQKA